MTNEMKLLTALINELGFDVEKVCVNQDDVDAVYTIQHKNQREFTGRGVPPLTLPRVEPIYEYKLSPKKAPAKPCFTDDQINGLRQSRIHATMYKEKI